MDRVDGPFLKVNDVTIPIAQLQQSVTMSVREIGLQSNNARVEFYYDHVCRNLVMSLRYFLAQSHVDKTETKESVETVSYPSTWWQHFKERWFPKWLLRRFPVQYVTFSLCTKYETANHYHCCPHLPADPAQSHVRFLTYQGNPEDLYRVK